MNYNVFNPSKELAPLVRCYWTLESTEQDKIEKQTIVPDGCMEMIFHYGDLFRQYPEDESSIIQPRCFVIGQITTPLQIEPTGKTGIFSVRFQPGGFAPFTTFPIKQTENTAVPLQTMFGQDGLDLEEAILTATSAAERIKIVEQFLLGRLADAATINRIIHSAVDSILEVNGQVSVHELTEQVQTNRKQLERKFASTIGLSPKQLCKIIRLQSTIRMMLTGESRKLTELAYEGDYYDQAHFIKDFREFTGLTPKKFYGDSMIMSKLFAGEA